MSTSHLDLFEDVDVIQVGARNMQNFELLKALGRTDKPILLKRGLANTIEELLMSAEYIMAGGNERVILCERGIRTYETFTRNTLDISAVPILKRLSHLPVVVDPSHASGINWLVEPLAVAAAAVGADGLIIEVHNDPSRALCDGAQSLTPDQFDVLAKKVRAVSETVRGLCRNSQALRAAAPAKGRLIFMLIAILGLGLIGGSIAKALKANTAHTVIGLDRDEKRPLDALSLGAIDRIGSTAALHNADVVYVCLYRRTRVAFVGENAARFKPAALWTDVCGIKGGVCGRLSALAAHGFIYVGGHRWRAKGAERL